MATLDNFMSSISILFTVANKFELLRRYMTQANWDPSFS